MKKTILAFMTVTSFAVGAQTETLRVSCEEYLEVTKFSPAKKPTCKQMPAYTVPVEKWHEMKASYDFEVCLRESGEDKLQPWNRTDKCKMPTRKK